MTAAYPAGAGPEYLSLIREPTPADPIYQQVAPAREELSPLGAEDPAGETACSPCPRLLHRYPDRVLILAAASCFVRCRHCMRKRLWKESVEPDRSAEMSLAGEWAKYLAAHSEVREIILSGGDPLTLADSRLEHILEELGRARPGVRFRVHSRAPVAAPSRITPRLARTLAGKGVKRLVTQFNHAREISAGAKEAVSILLRAGLQVENQAVLLRGVNDRPETLAELFLALPRIGVRAYYLHHPDLARGAAHFTLSAKEGWAIYQAARALVPAALVPPYVIDLPGPRPKTPVEILVIRRSHS